MAKPANGKILVLPTPDEIRESCSTSVSRPDRRTAAEAEADFFARIGLGYDSEAIAHEKQAVADEKPMYPANEHVDWTRDERK